MYVIIMGCGRLGAELAMMLEQDGHDLAVLDIDKYAFDHLGPDFKGRKILGDGTDQDTLRRAGAERADAFVAATRGDTGLRLAHEVVPDAVILDLGLPVMDGWTVLSHLRRHPATRDVPIHVVTGVGQAEAALDAGATTVSMKPVSPEDLAAALAAGTAPSRRRRAMGGDVLNGKRALIVDDDVRNVFALTSALEMHGLNVLYSDNGVDGVRLLAEHPEVDIVLMDAMMPEQDGYETTRGIRRNQRFADLPVVFLTAKAMPGDRESALAAGASDYITKPVDLDELIELMARWVNASDTSGTESENGL